MDSDLIVAYTQKRMTSEDLSKMALVLLNHNLRQKMCLGMEELIRLAFVCKDLRMAFSAHQTKEWMKIDPKYVKLTGAGVLEDFRLQWSLKREQELKRKVASQKGKIKRRKEKLILVKRELEEEEKMMEGYVEEQKRIRREIKVLKK
jgi:hypothetical protein